MDHRFFLKEDSFELSLFTTLDKEGAHKKDVFIVETAHITERLSDLYCITIKAYSTISNIDFKDMIHYPACLRIFYGEEGVRYFSGIVGEFEQGVTLNEQDITHYTIKLYPKLWTLHFNQDYKIFQNKTVKAILDDVFDEYTIEDYENKASKNGKLVRKYCVQYGESAFHFATRLMAEEGIFYYFEHTRHGEILKLSDDSTILSSISPGTLSIESGETYEHWLNRSHPPLKQEEPTEFWLDKIYVCRLEQRMVPKKAVLSDYNFISSKDTLFSITEAKVKDDGNYDYYNPHHAIKNITSNMGAMYRYPGRFFKKDTGDDLNAIHMEQLEWNQMMLHGETTAPGMCPGYGFSLSDHPREDVNQPYTIYEVQHFLDVRDGSPKIYYNTFKAIPKDIPFRPLPVPKPRIYSNQTAVVVGKEGEEIWTDEYGRIKVQFHWDQYGKNDEKSSCWIRVAQIWAGAGWGSIFIPRIGMEVVISFLEGDPDRPLVIGCVYNGSNHPPYSLPDHSTQSSLHTNSTKEGKDAYNEIRFEDKKDSEELYIRAQKDFNREVMKGDRSLLIHEGDDKNVISKGNYLLEHTAKDNKNPTHELHMIKGDHIINLDEGNQKITLKKGDQTFELGHGDQKITLKNGAMSITLNSGNGSVTLDNGDYSIKAAANTVKIKALNIKLEATNDLSLKGGNVKIESTTTDIQIKGMTDVKVDATAQFKSSSAIMELSATGQGTLKLGAMGEVKSDGMITLSANGMTKVKGAMVMIGP